MGPEPRDRPPGAGGDLELVRGALAGKRDEVRAFLARMHCVPRMIAAHNEKLGRPLADDELEDVVQETLVAIWRKLERFDQRAALETWVYPFCFYEFMRRLRSKRSLPRLLEDAPAGAHEPIAPEEVSLLEFEHVLAGLDALEPELAEVLRLKHLEDLTFEEIGRRLAISPNTAKTRHYRGLEKLRKRLGKRTERAEGGSA